MPSKVNRELNIIVRLSPIERAWLDNYCLANSLTLSEAIRQYIHTLKNYQPPAATVKTSAGNKPQKHVRKG
jgi:hypothetical protein